MRFGNIVLSFGILGSVLLLMSGCAHSACRQANPASVNHIERYGRITNTTQGREMIAFWRGSRLDAGTPASNEPPVLLLHELPGLSPATFQLADYIAEQGYTVYLPLFFGEAGDYKPRLNSVRVLFSPDWTSLRRDKTSPVMKRLRPLTDQIIARHSHQRLGVVGMCMSGALPLVFLANTQVNAVVLSQPALPFNCSKLNKRAPGIAADDLALARLRITRDQIPVLAWRFALDKISPRERFYTFADAFRQADGSTLFRDRTISVAEMEAHKVPHDAHAVLTGFYQHTPGHPTRQRFDEMMSYLNQRLKGAR